MSGDWTNPPTKDELPPPDPETVRAFDVLTGHGLPELSPEELEEERRRIHGNGHAVLEPGWHPPGWFEPDDDWDEVADTTAVTEDMPISVTSSAPDVNPARWFSKEDGFLVADLGEYVRAAMTIRLGYDNRLYRYRGGVYRPDGEQAVRVLAKQLLGRKFKRRHLEEVLAYLRADEPFIGEHPPKEMLNVANGLLDWHTRELRPHDPDVPSAVQVPVAWNPLADCHRILRFLGEVLPDDAVDHALEVLGYGLYPDNPLQRAVMVLGPGGNGKSVFLTVAGALYGKENISATSLQALSENRFSGAQLFGKLANVCGDLDARAIKRTDLFKQLTGGDVIQAERKFAHPFNFVCFALPMFSANEPPLSSDQSDAWFDRWLILPFEVRFRDTNAENPKLKDELRTREELEGLLVRAVDALGRLMLRGRFAPPESCQRAAGAYRTRLDTVRGFVEEHCVLHPDAWVARPALYKEYRRWAQDSGRMALSAESFYEHLRRNWPDSLQPRTRRGNRGWAGIGIAADHLDLAMQEEGS